ncbi:exosome complex exonuclease [Wickerhamomyces ciferrii]|uniref:Exosome complex exonuclease n=1 Tax=Wickerhamomyces ciferrii (strain ATCC 14091 / BCRC 22168 / CBS 111 / JCM 3599 / NBRC 0793 / NRRL Y-1031 F-60-10) TaxID=1206466 RepID=K0KJ20_WICCF|nr:exosome complex exonuclease [Wickerhamomyces ciferrii]CCH45225.1 exosome complex exonuclease [Wickerhamomyces ciferrii]
MEILSISKSNQFAYEDADASDSDIDLLSDNEEQQKVQTDENGLKKSVVTPGELVTDDPIWMRGHGTYYLENDTYSSVAGTISRVNRLLSVTPIRGRYQPETGDHVVGRITEVGQRRWKVDIGAKQDAVLMLGSVNLPGGVLRRKSESDELQMRNFLKEGDLLNAEVQSLFQDGSASLHTRSLKYGKLRNGIFLKVPSSLIVRAKNHSHQLPGNVSIIIGVNGYIWLRKTTDDLLTNNQSTIGKNASAVNSKGQYNPGQGSISITRLEEESSWEIYSDQNEQISSSIRSTITRYSNCIKILAHCELGITESRIISTYEASMAYENSGSLIDIETMETIGQGIITAEKYRGN